MRASLAAIHYETAVADGRTLLTPALIDNCVGKPRSYRVARSSKVVILDHCKLLVMNAFVLGLTQTGRKRQRNKGKEK